MYNFQYRTSEIKHNTLASKSSTGLSPVLASPRVELGRGWRKPSGIMSHCAADPLRWVNCCGLTLAECKSLMSQLQLMPRTKTTR